MHYVYADFKWDHCEEDFVGMLSGTLLGDLIEDPNSAEEATGAPNQQDQLSQDSASAIRASSKKSSGASASSASSKSSKKSKNKTKDNDRIRIRHR